MCFGIKVTTRQISSAMNLCMKSSLVTIIIPVYNGHEYISEAIDSALNQTYKNIEVIVINDGSNDGGLTEEVVKSYGDRINYITKENGGISSALNLGLSNMKGDYFSWLSHDDIYLPNKIEEQINFINNNNLLNSVIFSNFYSIDKFGNFISNSNLMNSCRLDFRTWITLFSELNGCTLLIPRSIISKYSFNESLKHIQDYDLWFKISYDFNFIYFPMYLVKSRQHDHQDSKKLQNIALIEVIGIKSNFIKCLTSSEMHVGGTPFYFLKLVKSIFELRILYGTENSLLLLYKIFKSKFKLKSKNYGSENFKINC